MHRRNKDASARLARFANESSASESEGKVTGVHQIIKNHNRRERNTLEQEISSSVCPKQKSEECRRLSSHQQRGLQQTEQSSSREKAIIYSEKGNNSENVIPKSPIDSVDSKLIGNRKKSVSDQIQEFDEQHSKKCSVAKLPCSKSDCTSNSLNPKQPMNNVSNETRYSDTVWKCVKTTDYKVCSTLKTEKGISTTSNRRQSEIASDSSKEHASPRRISMVSDFTSRRNKFSEQNTPVEKLLAEKESKQSPVDRLDKYFLEKDMNRGSRRCKKDCDFIYESDNKQNTEVTLNRKSETIKRDDSIAGMKSNNVLANERVGNTLEKEKPETKHKTSLNSTDSTIKSPLSPFSKSSAQISQPIDKKGNIVEGKENSRTNIDEGKSLTMQHFSEQQLLEFQDAFEVFDEDGNGEISTDELASVMMVVGKRPSHHELRTLISAVDQDENGTIDFEEFVIMMSRLIVDPETELKEVFNVFDQDRDGFISLPELHNILNKLGGPTVEMEEVAEMIRMADLDGDGQVSFHEFKIIIAGK